MGTFDLKKIDDCNSAISNILSSCCKSLQSFSNSLDTSRKNYENLNKKYETVQNDLKKCTDLKENLENELLAKFVLVVNEKKAKIRTLQKRLANCAPMETAESSSVSADNANSEIKPKTRNENPVSPKAVRLILEDSFDGGPVIPKRKRANKQPLTLSVSPLKAKDTPVSPVKFPSDCADSSDSTVDANELLEKL